MKEQIGKMSKGQLPMEVGGSNRSGEVSSDKDLSTSSMNSNKTSRSNQSNKRSTPKSNGNGSRQNSDDVNRTSRNKLDKITKQESNETNDSFTEFDYHERQTSGENRLYKKKSSKVKNSIKSDLPDPDVNSNMVYLNIYDLDSLSKVVNTVARSIGTGAFHAGVEVYGYEYSFGYITDGETGVTKTTARSHPYHVYRETIPMGKTPLTREEVDILVDVMKLQWIGNTYDLLSRNCLNYADYFCNLLDVGGVPEWVMSLQKKITWMKSNINTAATKLKALNKAAGIPNMLKYIKKKYKENTDDYEGCKVIVKS